ncbi:hypothetical protein J6590_100562 [Homalodisca vitripennis]|nr:hypothetical protein J6590_100562 [Homalodisca vitripennis]
MHGRLGIKRRAQVEDDSGREIPCGLLDAREGNRGSKEGNGGGEEPYLWLLLFLCLVYDAASDFTPEIWSHVRLKRSKKVDDEEAKIVEFPSFRHQRHL